MNSLTNFYEKMDMKYPEIAIAMEDIDRVDPQFIKFIIPVLTPNLPKDKLYDDKIRLNSSNLQNKDIKPEIEDLEIKNYVKIKISKELCAFVGGVFELEESQPMFVYPRGSVLHFRDGYMRIDDPVVKDLYIEDVYINSANQSGSGSVIEGGSIDVTGSIESPRLDGKIMEAGIEKGVGNIHDAIPRGFLNLLPVDRFIYYPSKWIVNFIGGDITKPRIVAPYIDEEPPEDDE